MMIGIWTSHGWMEFSTMDDIAKTLSIVLTEDEIPGAKLKLSKVEDHTVTQLKRWLCCRGLQQTGLKASLVKRYVHVSLYYNIHNFAANKIKSMQIDPSE